MVGGECQYAKHKIRHYFRDVSEQYLDSMDIMVLDGADWHSSSKLEEFDNIRLLLLPPYSPELNPAEHFCHYLREEYIINSFWRTFDELIDTLVAMLHDLITSNETVRSLAEFLWT